MVTRLLVACVATLALTVLTTATAWAKADDKGDTHMGVVVSATAGKLTMSDKDGKNEHTHDVAKDAKISLNGKDCKLEDLKRFGVDLCSPRGHEGRRDFSRTIISAPEFRRCATGRTALRLPP
jgi:hypothetical protein